MVSPTLTFHPANNYDRRGDSYPFFVLSVRHIKHVSFLENTSAFLLFHEAEFLHESTSILTAQTPGYIGEFEIVDDHRSGKIVVQLNGRLNKTGVISPRYNVQVTQIEAWVNLLLPARGFGIIILVSFIPF